MKRTSTFKFSKYRKYIATVNKVLKPHMAKVVDFHANVNTFMHDFVNFHPKGAEA